MKRSFVALMPAVFVVLALVGCAQAAPPPAPTSAPASSAAPQPTKPAASAPTTAPAAQPTAAPASNVQYPEKGKTISMIVGFAAGGTQDLYTRLAAQYLQNQLGTPVDVLNKPGANSQIAFTALAQAKPDGYTIGTVSLGALISTYLDPTLKTVYTRKSFQSVAIQALQPVVIVVKQDSPYKTVKDLVDAAKANPSKVTAGIGGILGPPDMGLLKLQMVSGAQFAVVVFDGGAPSLTAVLGGHVDVSFQTLPEVLQQFKAGQIRVLGIMGPKESKYLPGVKTVDEQGYQAESLGTGAIVAPAGISPDVLNTLSGTLQKISAMPDFQQKLDQLGFDPTYMGPADFDKFWADFEKDVPAMLKEAKNVTPAPK